MKLIANILLPVLLIVMVTGCMTEPAPPVREEAVDIFVDIVDETVATTETEVEKVDADLYDCKAKLLKLERITDPVLEWAESQKEDPQSGSWVRRLDPQWLKDTLTSDQYQVNEVVLTAAYIGSPSEKIILDVKILDVTNNAIYDWDVLDHELNDLKSDLERERGELIEIGKQAVTTLQRVIDYMDRWEVVEINENTYSIGGPGLGIPGEGTWIYYRDTGRVVPDDEDSSKLEEVLSGKR